MARLGPGCEAQDFGGREISEQNLCEWKAGGYQEWLARQEMLACARELAGDAAEVTAAAEGSLTDHLAVVLSARYAMLLAGWNGELDEQFRGEARTLRALCQDLVGLRRGDHHAGRLQLDRERFTEDRKDAAVQALEMVVEETQRWPEVRQTFQDAFAPYQRCQQKSAPPPPSESK